MTKKDKKYIEEENKEFCSIFCKVGSLIGFEVTDSDLLTKVGKQLLKNKYLGTFPYDAIPKNFKIGACCIINTDDSSKSGTHWVGLYRHDDNIYFFYDSYGNKYEKLIPNLKKFLPSKGPVNVISTQTIRQNNREYFCGASSLSWLIYLYRQPSPFMALVI